MITEAQHMELNLVPSERRAEVLVRLCAEAEVEDAREMLATYFNICDALAPWATELRAQFDRVGWVADNEEKLMLPVMVYRGGWEDDDPTTALSWTTELEVAQRFCRMLTGPRAKLVLGTYREGVDPAVFRGVCVSAYGWLTSREESEVIANTVVEIEAIQKLVTVAP